MFSIWGNEHKFCDGISRRNFLKIGAFGAGLTLADVLRLRAAAPQPAGRALGRAKSVIMIYLPGGPSHIDMYDLKPDAPSGIRGPFQPINTNVPGVRICELMPRQAQMWDKLACIRSIESVDEHSDSLIMTGQSDRDNMLAHHPSFGSVVSRVRSQRPAASELPFVSLRGQSRGLEPGFLGVAHRPFINSGPSLENLQPLEGVTQEQRTRRQSLLQAFDTARRDIDTRRAEGLDAFNQRALDMLANSGVRNALDLNRESATVRERFRGAESFLTARRLIEAGVGCVTVAYGGWDTHIQNFSIMSRQLPTLDRGVASLIQDLHERGLQDEVVTIVWGEFGRTPNINRDGGRDHWSPVMSCLIAGGGLTMGQAIGSSSVRAEWPRDRRCTVPRVLAMIYRAMGIDPATNFVNREGHPVPIIADREPIRELM